MNAHPLRRSHALRHSHLGLTLQRQASPSSRRLLAATRRLLPATLAFFCLSFTALPAWSANLLDAYHDARANDPVLGAARAQLAANKEAVPQTRSLLLPNIGMQGSTTWNERELLDTGFPVEKFNNHGWGAQLSQPILNMESWYTHSSARAGVNAARHQFSATDQELIVRTVAAYLDVLRADSLVESASRAEAATQRQLEQVQQRFDVGLVAITDVLEAQAGYDNSVVVSVQAVGDHDIFFEVLRTLAVQPYTEIQDISEDLPIINPEPSDVEEWVSTALATNPTVLSSEEQLNSANRTVRARRSGHLPTIDGTITFNHFVNGSALSIGNTRGKSETTVYGLRATLPIYQGGFTSSRTKEAQALSDRSSELLQDSRLRVSRDTRNLFRRVATDVVRVGARLKAIASAESALEATETGYEVGTRNVVDVLRAQENFFRSQFDYADSRYNYMLSLIMLKQQTGLLNEQDVIELNQFADPNKLITRITTLSSRTGR